MNALDDLARVERAIEEMIKTHGAAVVRRHFTRLPMQSWSAWQRVHGVIERYAKKARHS